MKKLTTDTFLSQHSENTTAIRIKDSQVYFLGWIEDAENYGIVKAIKDIPLAMDLLMLDSIYTAVTVSDGWQNCQTTCVDYDKAEEKRYDQEEYILGLVNSYSSDENDYEILMMSTDEFQHIIDALKDGDYIIIINDEDEIEVYSTSDTGDLGSKSLDIHREYDKLSQLVKKAKELEVGLHDGEEIEIELYDDGTIAISRYNLDRGSAIELLKFCSSSELNLDDLRKTCDLNGWFYVI